MVTSDLIWYVGLTKLIFAASSHEQEKKNKRNSVHLTSVPPVGTTQALPLQICFKSHDSSTSIGWHDLELLRFFFFFFRRGVASCTFCYNRQIDADNPTKLHSDKIRSRHRSCDLLDMQHPSGVFLFSVAETLLHHNQKKVDRWQRTKLCMKSRLRYYNMLMSMESRIKVECHASLLLGDALSGRSDKRDKMTN